MSAGRGLDDVVVKRDLRPVPARLIQPYRRQVKRFVELHVDPFHRAGDLGRSRRQRQTQGDLAIDPQLEQGLKGLQIGFHHRANGLEDFAQAGLCRKIKGLRRSERRIMNRRPLIVYDELAFIGRIHTPDQPPSFLVSDGTLGDEGIPKYRPMSGLLEARRHPAGFLERFAQRVQLARQRSGGVGGHAAEDEQCAKTRE